MQLVITEVSFRRTFHKRFREEFSIKRKKIFSEAMRLSASNKI